MEDLNKLIDLAQAGCEDAYTQITTAFHDMAYMTAYRYVQDYHLAQDIVQEAFTEAFAHLAQIKNAEAFPAWFRQIVFRQCTRLMRKTTVQCEDLAEIQDVSMLDDCPENICAQLETQRQVHNAIGALAEHEQQVIVLYYFQHYSQQEIGTLLGLPITTVKKRLYFARQHLKMSLQDVVGVAIGVVENRDEESTAVVEREYYQVKKRTVILKERMEGYAYGGNLFAIAEAGRRVIEMGWTVWTSGRVAGAGF